MVKIALIIAAMFIAGVLAVLIFLTAVSLTAVTVLGWVLVVFGLYLASLLVP